MILEAGVSKCVLYGWIESLGKRVAELIEHVLGLIKTVIDFLFYACDQVLAYFSTDARR